MLNGLKLCFYILLYNQASYSHILICSHLRSVRGQTPDWRHHYKVLLTLIPFTQTIIMSTAHTSSMFLLSYTNMVFNQSVHIFVWSDVLWINENLIQQNWPAVRIIFPNWFDHLEEGFCYSLTKVISKIFACLQKPVAFLLKNIKWNSCIGLYWLSDHVTVLSSLPNYVFD